MTCSPTKPWSPWDKFAQAAQVYEAKYGAKRSHGNTSAAGATPTTEQPTTSERTATPAVAQPPLITAKKAKRDDAPNPAPVVGPKAAPRAASNWLAAASASKSSASAWSAPKPTLIVRRDPRSAPRSKIAAFDFDGTLTTCSVTSYSATSVRAWTLQKLYD